MMSVFNEYAWSYDLLYRDKPYAAEAAFVDGLIRHAHPGRSRPNISVLDLACGSARHAIRWRQLGYVVEGSEPSAEMRKLAQANIAQAGVELPIHPYAFQDCALVGGVRDIVTCMFGSLGYLSDVQQLVTSLKQIGSILSAEGRFIFDHWNGLTVPNSYSPVKVLDVRDGTRRVHRVSRTRLDRMRGVAEVEFSVMIIEDNIVRASTTELHTVRYFTPTEIELALRIANMQVVDVVPFMAADRRPIPDDWNLTVLARRTV